MSSATVQLLVVRTDAATQSSMAQAYQHLWARHQQLRQEQRRAALSILYPRIKPSSPSLS